ncbi:MAG: nucleotidyltransferase domain-containing protein [Anaerolineae bacterium]|nr:nucleotidyltransferase domain-containing protein [Anaerolineae bacterium]
MNTASRWRVTVAERIASVYMTYPQVKAIVLVGGIARGGGDAFSDVDLAVFWQDRVGEAESRQALARLESALGLPLQFEQLDIIQAFDAPGADGLLWEDVLYLPNGLKVDIDHRTVEAMERILDDVTHRYDTNGHKLEVLYSIQRVRVLHGAELVQEWQSRAREYPNELARRVAEGHLVRMQPSLEMHISRGDWLLVYRTLVGGTQDIIGLLCALNRIHRPDYKRLRELCAQLTLKPDRLYERISDLLCGPPDDAAETFDTLAEETFALIEEYLPQVNIESARQRLYQRRKAIFDPPAGFVES